jgi:hypothetical protein
MRSSQLWIPLPSESANEVSFIARIYRRADVRTRAIRPAWPTTCPREGYEQSQDTVPGGGFKASNGEWSIELKSEYSVGEVLRHLPRRNLSQLKLN